MLWAEEAMQLQTKFFVSVFSPLKFAGFHYPLALLFLLFLYVFFVKHFDPTKCP